MNNLHMHIVLLIYLLMLASCGSKNEGTEAAAEAIANNPMSEEAIIKIKLNDNLMKKYINAIRVLKEKGQEIDNNANAISSLYQYSQLESLVKETDFENINEFLAVHTKVVWSMVSLQSSEEIKNIEYDKAKSESEKGLEEALNNPNLTEEAKKQLEQAKDLMDSSLAQSKESVQQYLEQIKKYATEEDIAIVKRYTADLKKIYEME